MGALQWLIFVLLPGLVTSFDPSISNGTCYFGPNKQATNNFIPCGNSAGGVQSCCQARDVCLSSNACFNGQYYITYLAGCTDENYDDPSCPDKGAFSSQQWVGLVRCHVSDDDGEQWAGCQEPSQTTVNKGNQQCTCIASSSTALFVDSATLTNIASLPVSVGNAIAWESGFTPSTTFTDATTSQSGSTQTPVSTTKSNAATEGITSASSPLPTILSESQSTSLSTSAKAGIGIGAALGALVVGALTLWFAWYRRRKSRRVLPIQDQIRPASIGWGSPGDDFVGDKHNRQEKSELPTEANEVDATKTSLGGRTLKTTFNTPATTYLPYRHSPSAEASEVEGSPAGSTSRLAHSSTYEKPRYSGPVYEMPA